ncbi:phosphopantetheine-binding protein, partial [Paraburkholderia jirisanensis]
VPHDERTPSSAELRAFLADQLAEYMVPAAFVVLPALPLTPNGKLDRQALPAPDQGALATRAYEAPLGEVETTLAAIWQQLLGIERVGRNDHFFELGGHSLLAVQLMTRIRESFGIEVLLKSLFDGPLLSQLADHLTSLLLGHLPAQHMADLAEDLDNLSESELLALLNEEIESE